MPARFAAGALGFLIAAVRRGASALGINDIAR
jgi:hypothetical protein